MAATGSLSDSQHAGVTAALKTLKAAKRKPGGGDRPKPSTFAGRKAKVIPGQMTLGDVE